MAAFLDKILRPASHLSGVIVCVKNLDLWHKGGRSGGRCELPRLRRCVMFYLTMTAPRRGGTTTAPRGAATTGGLRTAAAPRGPAQAVPRAPCAQAAACASEIIDSSRNAAPSVNSIVFISFVTLIEIGRVLRIIGVFAKVSHRTPLFFCGAGLFHALNS